MKYIDPNDLNNNGDFLPIRSCACVGTCQPIIGYIQRAEYYKNGIYSTKLLTLRQVINQNASEITPTENNKKQLDETLYNIFNIEPLFQSEESELDIEQYIFILLSNSGDIVAIWYDSEPSIDEMDTVYADYLKLDDYEMGLASHNCTLYRHKKGGNIEHWNGFNYRSQYNWKKNN